jgi:hypothetical protein
MCCICKMRKKTRHCSTSKCSCRSPNAHSRGASSLSSSQPPPPPTPPLSRSTHLPCLADLRGGRAGQTGGGGDGEQPLTTLRSHARRRSGGGSTAKIRGSGSGATRPHHSGLVGRPPWRRPGVELLAYRALRNGRGRPPDAGQRGKEKNRSQRPRRWRRGCATSAGDRLVLRDEILLFSFFTRDAGEEPRWRRSCRSRKNITFFLPQPRLNFFLSTP